MFTVWVWLVGRCSWESSRAMWDDFCILGWEILLEFRCFPREMFVWFAGRSVWVWTRGGEATMHPSMLSMFSSMFFNIILFPKKC